MLLSQIVDGYNGNLVRDGYFKRLDYCTVYEKGPFLTFMENEKFIDALSKNMEVGCVLCRPELANLIPAHIDGLYLTDEPKALFIQLHNKLSKFDNYCLPTYETVIGENTQISPLSVIPKLNVTIGDNVIIEPFTVIGEHVEIGNNCIIHSHATIGGRSFSYARIGEDDVIGLNDCGKVMLESGVEIMSYTHIARGILPTDVTHIGKNSILDAHVHIGHGADINERVFIAANALISGNAVIGKDSWVGVSATVSNRVVVGENCRVSIGSVVTKNVPDGMTVTGNFAVEHSRFIQELKNRNKCTSDFNKFGGVLSQIHDLLSLKIYTIRREAA